jgi:hypothetical protein
MMPMALVLYPLSCPLADNGVDGTDDIGALGEHIQVGHHRFLKWRGNVGTGNVEHPEALQGLAEISGFDHKGHIGPFDARSADHRGKHRRRFGSKHPLIADDTEHLFLVFVCRVQNA